MFKKKIAINLSDLHLQKNSQTPTTCHLQPKFSEHFKKTLSKTRALSSGNISGTTHVLAIKQHMEYYQ